MVVRTETNINEYSLSRKSITKFDDFVFWFSMIDLLFLPYFTFISVSYSVPIIAIWLLLHVNSKISNNEQAVMFLIAITMVASSLIAVVYTGEVRFETTLSTTIKRCIQFLICFGYYFFYKYYFSTKKVDLSRWMFAFTVFVFVFSLFFLINPNLYANIKIAINRADNHTRRFLANQVPYRFNYLWTDPNNIAYLVAGNFYWYLTRDEVKILWKFLLAILSIFIILATSSNGGMILLVIMILFMAIGWLYHKMQDGKIKIGNALFSLIAILGIITVLNIDSVSERIFSNYLEKIQNRLTLYTSSNNLSGGRVDDLMVSLKYLNPIFLIIGSGKEGFSSENGHLYWICMYGLPSYIGFMWLMFRKTRKQKLREYIWIIPFFVCFTMNIGIGEFKWMAIFLLLLANSRSECGRDINTYGREEKQLNQ